MTADRLVVRSMRRDELDMVIEWAAAEGWNPGLHDADAYFAADPEGFFIGLLDGEPVASVSAVRYSPDYVFMGFLIVRPALRGGLLGPRLVEHAFRHAGDSVAGADGVLVQADRYRTIWGFEPAYHNMRYRGVVTQRVTDPNVKPYTAADFNAVEGYDSRCFPAPRHAFLERWLQQPEAHAFVFKDGEVLRGYGMVRPARDGYRVGPLFADGELQANALFDALAARLPAGTPVYIDIPQPNATAIDLVTRRGMTPMFETVRMYRGGAPSIEVERVFGVASLELG